MLKKRKNVLIVAPTQGGYGGIEATVLAQSKAIFGKKKFNLKIVFKLVSGFEIQEELIDIFKEHGLYFEVVGRLSLDLLKYIYKADIVHGHNASPDVVLFSKLFEKLLVLTIHNKLIPSFSLHYFLWTIVNRLADFRIYNSNFVNKTWEGTRIKYNSCCIPSVSSMSKLKLSTKPRKGFLFISRWIKNKGINELIKSYDNACIDKKEWPLTMMGDGPERKWVKEYISRSKSTEIKLLGFVDERTKFEYINKSKWMISPSNGKEDLGLTPIEARFFGVPSIVTNDGGLPEAGGPTALICEPGDVKDLTNCIERVTKMCEEEYEKRSKGALDSLKTFLKPMSVYSQIYLKLLNNN